MAEISIMILLHNLEQHLAQVNSLPGFQNQVRELYRHFEIVLAFLKNREETGAMGLLGESTSDKISDLAFKSEDIVDRWVSDAAKRKRESSKTSAQEMSSVRLQLRSVRNDLWHLSYNEIGIYHNSIENGRVQKQAVQASPTRGWVVEEDVTPVSFTKHCERLVDRLINGGGPELDVIAIVGEGGTGKTTLAKKVYNDVSVKNHFKSRGWMLVSSNYNLRNLLLSLLSDFMVITEDIYDMEDWELKRQLSKQLTGRRYLIVIDDVHTKAWNELKDAFPKYKHSSRILVTTRCSTVVSSLLANPYKKYFELGFLRQGRPYSETRNFGCFDLTSLSEEESWELFCRKIFGEKGYCPKEFEHLGRRAAKSCRGLLIKIDMVARILRANEMTFSRWHNKISQIRERSDILTLCYLDLPLHLKPCFLHLSVFPEDTEIPVKQLIQLWIAEGLIQVEENTNRSMEDVAEAYLEGLIGRNWIQVTKRRSDGGAKVCCIHDILRDLSINLSKEAKYLEVCANGHSSSQCEPRRLSILSDSREYISHITEYRLCYLVRSFFCFCHDIQSVLEEDWESLFLRSELLRVLFLGEGKVGKVSGAIQWLIHLRYLKMKPAKNIRVPKSIFNLWNLQTIDLRTTKFPEMPKEIWKMQQLRHLYLDGPSRLPNSERKQCLPNLQTLCYISNDPDNNICISEKAPNLRKLGLYEYHCFCRSEQDATFNLPYLQSLKFVEECTFEDLEEPIKLPATITKITVKRAHLQSNAIKMFEELPNLQILKLIQTSFDDDEVIFGENSFSKLKLLKFENSNIVTWRLEKGAIPNLLCLVISKCPLLEELPAELWEVNKLKKLELFWASPTLAKKLDADLKENKGLNLMIHSTSGA